MATVVSLSRDDGSQIQWESTNGNEVTFRINTDVSTATGAGYRQTGFSVHNNNNYPTEIPEVHIDIEEDSNGTEVLHISELVTVTMDDINGLVAIEVVVKENGEIRWSESYCEQPANLTRGIIGPATGDAAFEPGDIGPPDLPDGLTGEDLDQLEDIGPPE